MIKGLTNKWEQKNNITMILQCKQMLQKKNTQDFGGVAGK